MLAGDLPLELVERRELWVFRKLLLRSSVELRDLLPNEAITPPDHELRSSGDA